MILPDDNPFPWKAQPRDGIPGIGQHTGCGAVGPLAETERHDVPQSIGVAPVEIPTPESYRAQLKRHLEAQHAEYITQAEQFLARARQVSHELRLLDRR